MKLEVSEMFDALIREGHITPALDPRRLPRPNPPRQRASPHPNFISRTSTATSSVRTRASLRLEP